jgi:N-acetylated-alpha-linked acidic dipeptidase
VAAEKGAIGCILYSDPRNDGYYQGDVYPKGSFKNDKGVQRGSVEDMPIYPGDPLTPGVGATKDAKRLEIKDAPTLTKIPVLPISHSDALPLLQAMEGPVAPENWRGALPITYHLGPGATKVRLKLEFNWNIEPAYDVIATMKGSDLPDQWIIRGNHHDAWANGANDPTSGMVALMEEARGIAELAKNGWRPKRTIIYCAWDAEEPGLPGSTEWAEHHAEELKDKAAIYINTDSNGRGFLRMSGSHTLEKFINQVARDVTDPQKGIAVFDRLRAARMLRGSADSRKEAQQRKDLRIGALGSGSDYTPFLQHLGIACLNLGYGGENAGGEYHSIYDSFDHYTRFGDPKFEYGIALAKTAGRAVLRLVNADILPFEFQNFTNTVSKYVEEVMKLTDDMRVETERENRLIREGTYKAVFDPTKPFVMPEPKDAVPHLNFAPLQNAFAQLERSAGDFEKVMNGLSRSANAIRPNAF